MVVVYRHRLPFHRELVNPAGAESRGGLTSQHELLRQLGIRFLVTERAVVEARHIHDGCHMVGEDMIGAVHAVGHGTGGILAVADILQETGHLRTLRVALLLHLVADAPHHHTRVVAVVVQHVGDILLRPLVEIAVIAILHLWYRPLVEGLHHQHHPHLICYPHIFRCGHVVRGADSVDAHILHDAYLAAYGCLVHGSAKRTQIVMQADTLKLDLPPIEVEAVVGTQFDGAYAEGGGHIIHHVGHFFGGGFRTLIFYFSLTLTQHGLYPVEVGLSDVPQLRVVHY